MTGIVLCGIELRRHLFLQAYGCGWNYQPDGGNISFISMYVPAAGGMISGAIAGIMEMPDDHLNLTFLIISFNHISIIIL